MERYFDLIDNDFLRKLFTCFRLSSHKLAIETGRFTGVQRENRMCQNCNMNVLESEYHFLLTCTKYTSLRNKFLPNISWPDLRKFVNLLSSKNKKTLIGICKFLRKAYEARDG